MIRRFLSSRGAKKFRRNRLAMVALGVILAYFGVACYVWLGDGMARLRDLDDQERHDGWVYALHVQKTTERIGPDTKSGLSTMQDAEKRSQHMEFYLTRLERALEADDPETALKELHFAEMRPAQKPVEELEAGLEASWETFDELDEFYEELDEAEEELLDLEEAFADTTSDARPTAEAVEEARARVTGLAPQLGAIVARMEEQVEELFPTPQTLGYRIRMLFGTDRQGRSIMIRALYSIKTAIQVGVVTALISVIFGSILGAAAAMYGGWVDHVVIWLYSTFSSIPNLVLLTVLAFMFSGSKFDGTMIPLYAAFCLTFWIGPCRVIRGEALKIKELEYVQAANAAGFSRLYILLRHVLPNTSHLIFINFSLLFIAAIKGEVILTFLGLGLKEGASWGIMIDQSRAEVLVGYFWQIGVATGFMFLLVLAFNILTDALQDAFDPKHVG